MAAWLAVATTCRAAERGRAPRRELTAVGDGLRMQGVGIPIRGEASRLSREEVAVLSSPRPRRSRPTAGDDADGSFVGSKHRDVRRAYPAKRKQRAATSSSSSSSSPPTATERLRNRGRLVPSNRVDKKMRRFVGTVNKFDAAPPRHRLPRRRRRRRRRRAWRGAARSRRHRRGEDYSKPTTISRLL
ncbi:hypothetical protein OsJ_07163 [Oryza sativa Japonica Group]|uniref:Uncharacterized protein n=1 Tax=Oryza sativa subsp. japonica TaxID=39947 RepID=A3A831_ORYSJ|nr:hypothetical protein OsJ_07163 [Oryza sativa Japonica Group]